VRVVLVVLVVLMEGCAAAPPPRPRAPCDAAAAVAAFDAQRDDVATADGLRCGCAAGVTDACQDEALLIELCSEGGRGVMCDALRRAGRLHAPTPPPPAWHASEPPPPDALRCFRVTADAPPPPRAWFTNEWNGDAAAGEREPPRPPDEAQRGAIHCMTRDRWTYRGARGEWDQQALGSWERLGTEDRWRAGALELTRSGGGATSSGAVWRAATADYDVELASLAPADDARERAAIARLPDLRAACRGLCLPAPDMAPPDTLRACLAYACHH
jgi:hypothetical protein